MVRSSMRPCPLSRSVARSSAAGSAAANLDLGAERGLVGLDGQQGVGAGASDRAGDGSVGGDGVDRDQRALEPSVLGQALDQGRDGGGLIPSRSLADSWGGFPGGHRYGSRWRSPVWRSPWLLPSRSAVTLMPPNSALWRSARGIPIRPGAFWLWRRSMMGPPGPKRLRSAA